VKRQPPGPHNIQQGGQRRPMKQSLRKKKEEGIWSTTHSQKRPRMVHERAGKGHKRRNLDEHLRVIPVSKKGSKKKKRGETTTDGHLSFGDKGGCFLSAERSVTSGELKKGENSKHKTTFTPLGTRSNTAEGPQKPGVRAEDF